MRQQLPYSLYKKRERTSARKSTVLSLDPRFVPQTKGLRQSIMKLNLSTMPIFIGNCEDGFSQDIKIFNKEGKEKIANYIRDLKATGMYTAVDTSDTATVIENADIIKEEPSHLLPVAAHNDFADDEEEQRLMREDLDEL
jgi:hypothetical protein